MSRFQQCVVGCGALSLIAYVLLGVVSYVDISHAVRIWSYVVIVTVTTASPLALLLIGGTAKAARTRAEARLAFWFAVAFGIVGIMTLPIFGGDFWYYLAEGRLAAAGGNVYRDQLTAAALDQVPVPEFAKQITLPYGPAWVWISIAASLMTAPSLAWEFAAYKAIMFFSWLATLRLIFNWHRDHPARQFQSVLVLGWLPFAMTTAIIDAHNDIVMIALALFWLAGGSAMSTVPLVASVLVKYTSAPILALATVDAVLRRSWQALLVLAATTALALLVLVTYWQDGALIDGLRFNQGLRRYTPVALLDWLVRAQGFPAGLATVGKVGWRLALAGLAVWYAWRYWRAPTRTSRAALATVLMFAVVLGADYLHPHYFLWVLPCMLLASDGVLAVLTVPFILFLPFMQILRVSGGPLSTPLRYTAVLQLLVVTCWIACAWRYRAGFAKREPVNSKLAVPLDKGA